MSKRILAAIATLAAAGWVTPAHATPVTYEEKVNATGSLGSSPFSNALLTFDLTADTSAVSCAPPICAVAALTATVDVTSIGTATLTDPIDVLDNSNFGGQPIAGFGVHNQPRLPVTVNSAFATYDLTTSIGPLSGAKISFLPTTFNTTAGALAITGFSDAPSTFQATVEAAVPEPGTLMHFGTGAVALVGRRLRRRPTPAR